MTSRTYVDAEDLGESDKNWECKQKMLTDNHLVQEGRADQTHPLTNPAGTQTQSHNSNLDHLVRRPTNRDVV